MLSIGASHDSSNDSFEHEEFFNGEKQNGATGVARTKWRARAHHLFPHLSTPHPSR
jgi:hypothetical protein